MTVLDVGCGTGAITAGIAKLVAPQGRVVGVDRDETLLAVARQEYGGAENLSFEHGDVLSLNFSDAFDVVTAARTLQWVSEPGRAVHQMTAAAKVAGRIVVLDYNHADNRWEPDPPTEFVRFYAAFLEWRTANRWSNRMADELPELLRAAGVTDVRIHADDQIAERGDPDFSEAVDIWSAVIENVGPRVVASGHLTERELASAGEHYREYVQYRLQRQTLSMKTVEGFKAARPVA